MNNIKKVGEWRGYSVYEDSEGTIGVRKGSRICTLMRQTEQRWVGMTFSDLFLFGEEGNFDTCVEDLKYEIKQKQMRGRMASSMGNNQDISAGRDGILLDLQKEKVFQK